jgi:hypothetical protein
MPQPPNIPPKPADFSNGDLGKVTHDVETDSAVFAQIVQAADNFFHTRVLLWRGALPTTAKPTTIFISLWRTQVLDRTVTRCSGSSSA